MQINKRKLITRYHTIVLYVDPARRAEGNWFLEEGRRYLVEYHWYSNYWSVETSF